MKWISMYITTSVQLELNKIFIPTECENGETKDRQQYSGCR